MLLDDQVYSARGVAKELGIAPRTVYNLAKKKRIPYFKADEKSSMRFAGWRIKQWINDELMVNPEVERGEEDEKTDGTGGTICSV